MDSRDLEDYIISKNGHAPRTAYCAMITGIYIVYEEGHGIIPVTVLPSKISVMNSAVSFIITFGEPNVVAPI